MAHGMDGIGRGTWNGIRKETLALRKKGNNGPGARTRGHGTEDLVLASRCHAHEGLPLLFFYLFLLIAFNDDVSPGYHDDVHLTMNGS